MSTVDETALRDRLRAEGLGPSAWGNGPHDRYGAHDHGYDKVIVVAAGAVRVGLPGTGGGHDLVAGDRVEVRVSASSLIVIGNALRLTRGRRT